MSGSPRVDQRPSRITRIVRAVEVAVRNGVSSFKDYYERGFDPQNQDALTLAWNRRCFERRRREVGAYSLLLLDLDHFKVINDRHGHSVGDEVLRAVAAVLRASSGDRVFRLGGEEFAVMLACDAAGALVVAERLRETVRRLDLLTGHPITVSIGVAWSSGTQPDHELIYRLADEALYRAKDGGRDRVELMCRSVADYGWAA